MRGTKSGKIRVLLVTSFPIREGSGVGITEYAFRLFEAIKRLPNLEVSTKVVYTNKTSHLQNKGSGHKESKPPDIVHYLEPVISYKESRGKASPKSVVTIHDIDPIMDRTVDANYIRRFNRFPITIALNRILNRFVNYMSAEGIRRAVKNADHLICVSETTKKEVVKYLNVNPNNCSVVYPIIGSQFRKLSKPKGKRKVVVGHISSYFDRKNAKALVDAFRETKNSDTELRLYGRRPPFDISGDNRISYRGHGREKNMPRIFNSFDVFVFPSLWEGFGMPVMEAKRCKVPVITYKKGLLPDIVKRNTLQFSGKRDLIRILENREWSRIDTEKAYQDAEKCDADPIANQIVKIYEDILDRNSDKY